MMLTDFDLCHTQAKMPILLFQKNQKYQVSQDTMVLGKNVRHSIGRVQDRIPSPTLREREKERENLREFGNETKNEREARPRTTTDARARSQSRTRF